MVKVPQGLCVSALTTASPKPARATMMMNRMAIDAATPPTGPIASLAIWASERPLRLTDAANMTTSCTEPARAAPIRIQRNPGR